MIVEDRILHPRGEFALKVFDRGQLIECHQGNNLIVSAASDPLARLLAGEGQGKAATQIGFGISATEASEDDTALVGAYIKPLAGHDYPAAGRVRFRWALGSAEANGKQIREFGLLAADGTLIARKVRPSGAMIEKSTDLSLTGTWTIIF